MTGADFRRWREERGLTQAEAGRAVGVDGRVWRRWEAHEGEVKMSAVIERALRDVDQERACAHCSPA